MVNNIPNVWTAAELEAMFAAFGSVESCNVVTDKQTQASKGFGFVKFVNRTEAEEAMNTLNGTSLEGRTLIVKKAALGKGPQGTANIYISGFTPNSVTEESLQSIFSQYGTVQRVKLHPPQPGKKGVAFVTYQCFAEAELACSVANMQALPTGEVVSVKFDARTAQMAQGVVPAPGAMKGRNTATQAGRFQPYQASPMGAMKPPMAAAAQYGGIVPLPNGADGNYCLFVHGPNSPQILQQLCLPFGAVAHVRMQPGKKFGFVSMPNYHEAINCVNNLNGRALQGGITLQVRLAADSKKEGDPTAAPSYPGTF